MFNRSDYVFLLAMSLNVNQPLDLSDLFDDELLITAILTRNFQYFCLYFQH